MDFAELMKGTEAAFDSIRERAGKSKVEFAIYSIERTYR
jgi:hypothetical protein